MFERFSKDARLVVVTAQETARDLRHQNIGTEHLLLCLTDGEGPAGRALRAQGVTADDLRARVVRLTGKGEDPLDPEALRTLGIDIDAVREATENTFGEGALDVPPGRFRSRKGHIPFRADAKKALELSLRHALRLKHKNIETGHVLLGVLHDETNPAVRVLTDAGVNIEALRTEVTRLTSPNAA